MKYTVRPSHSTLDSTILLGISDTVPGDTSCKERNTIKLVKKSERDLCACSVDLFRKTYAKADLFQLATQHRRYIQMLEVHCRDTNLLMPFS